MRNRDRDDGGRLPERLRTFGEFVADEAPLYAALSRAASEEPVALRILGEAPHEQPPANILLGGVHSLLMAEPDHPLADHYPSIAGSDEKATGDPVPLFIGFCRDRETELTTIAATRTVQTNEVRRCVGLLPALDHLGDAPLALIEIGCSAGLNLLVDRYRYDYSGTTAGPADADLVLDTELRSGKPGVGPVSVGWRTGIDLHPIDVTDDDAIRWARALLWPNQVDRIARFDAAVGIARHDPTPLRAGDALDLLPEVAADAPLELRLVIFHTFVLNQFTEEQRQGLDTLIAGLSASRPVDRIGIDMLRRGAEAPIIRHTRYRGGVTVEERALGSMHHHGAWLEWGT